MGWSFADIQCNTKDVKKSKKTDTIKLGSYLNKS